MDKYMYVISDNKIGLILNPNAGAEEYYRVAFAPDDIRDVADGDYEWFGECESGYANFQNAYRALQERGIELTPVGKLYNYPVPPYAGAWDGGSSFSREICCGNFCFGGEVTGARRPVWIYTGEGGDLWAAWQAVETVTITATGGHSKKTVTIPPGGFWCLRYRDYSAHPVLAAFPREDHGQTQVDLLHRW